MYWMVKAGGYKMERCLLGQSESLREALALALKQVPAKY